MFFSISDVFKILHILASSFGDASKVLKAALPAGFRESGVMSLSDHPMVAVRSLGLAFDCVVGFMNPEGIILSCVTENYLQMLVGISKDRFKTNNERIRRFQESLLGSSTSRKLEREDAETRRQRKKLEGLAIQEQRKMDLEEVGEPSEADPGMHTGNLFV